MEVDGVQWFMGLQFVLDLLYCMCVGVCLGVFCGLVVLEVFYLEVLEWLVCDWDECCFVCEVFDVVCCV